MSNYIDDTAGSTITEGLDDYLIFGDVLNFSPMIGNLTNGQEYAYKAVFSDGATEGYENGVGTWNSSTNRLSRDTIKKSSNNDNKVSWPAGDKAIYIVADTELLTDMEQMVEGATKKILTASERSQIAANTLKNSYPSVDAAKVAHISVSSDVNLDQMAADINALGNGMVYKGNWDASAGTFPGSGIAQIGWFYYVGTAGTVDGVSFDVGDNVVAVVNNASISTYTNNWSKHDQTDQVTQGDLDAAIADLEARGMFPPPGGKFLVGYTGQSPCAGAGYDTSIVAGTFTDNTKIQDLRYSNQAAQTGTLAFTTATTEYLSGYVGNAGPNSGVFVGMAGKCNIASEGLSIKANTLWIALNELSQRYPEVEFRIVTAYRGETAIEEGWENGDGVEAAFTTAMNAAKSALGLDYAHAIVWDQAHNNWGDDLDTYAAAGVTFKELCETKGYADPQNTRWFVMGFSDEWNTTGDPTPSPFAVGGFWPGPQAMAAAMGAELVSGAGVTTVDTVHPDLEGSMRRGLNLADAIEGVSQRIPEKFVPAERVSWLRKALSYVVSAANAVGFDLKVFNNLTHSGTKLFRVSNHDDSVQVGWDKDGWPFDSVWSRSGSVLSTLREHTFGGPVTLNSELRLPPLLVSNANVALSADDCFAVMGGTFTANRTISLPPTTSAIGRTYILKNNAVMGAYTLTVACDAGEFMADSLATSFKMASGETVIITVYQTGFWVFVASLGRPQRLSIAAAATKVTSSSFDLSASNNADLFETIVFTGSGNVTLTLPLVSTHPFYKYNVINNKSSGSIAIAYQSGDSAGTWYSDPTPTIGDSIIITNDGALAWLRVGGKTADIYGTMSVNTNVTAETTLSTVTPGLLQAFNTNGLCNGCTADNANNIITVLHAGKYECHFNWSGSTSDAGAVNKYIEFDFAVNGTIIAATVSERKSAPATTGMLFGGAIQATLTLSANDEVSIKHLIQSGMTAFTCWFGQLYIKRISD